jgi:hypothetical protein
MVSLCLGTVEKQLGRFPDKALLRLPDCWRQKQEQRRQGDAQVIYRRLLIIKQTSGKAALKV